MFGAASMEKTMLLCLLLGAIGVLAELSPVLAQGLENPSGQFRVGIQTQKNVETPGPLRRSDCEINDECDEYSGLPQSQPRNITTKNFRTPFVGLSITAPLQ